MSSPLKRIEKLILSLPGKDVEIAQKYLKTRNFESILEIVESDLYKAEKSRIVKLEEVSDDYVAALTELRGELLTYMSYLEVPDNSNDCDYY